MNVIIQIMVLLKNAHQMSFKKYLDTIGDNFTLIKKHSKLSGKLAGLEVEGITHLSYRDLKETIPELFKNLEFERAMYIVFEKKINFKRILREKNSRKLIFLLWLKDQYRQIEELEEHYLTLLQIVSYYKQE